MSQIVKAKSAPWFVRQWNSKNPSRMIDALTSVVQCPETSCQHRFVPLESIDQLAFVKCPNCRKSLQLGQELTPHWLSAGSRFNCDGCFCEADGTLATFRQNIGLIVVRFHQENFGAYCSACIHRLFWTRTIVTAGVGWIGLTSLLVAPVYILQNLYNYLSALPRSKPAISSRSPHKYPTLFEFLDPHRPELLQWLALDVGHDDSMIKAKAHSLGVLAAELDYYLQWLAWETTMSTLAQAGENVPADVFLHLNETAHRLGQPAQPMSDADWTRAQKRKYVLTGANLPPYQPDRNLLRPVA